MLRYPLVYLQSLAACLLVTCSYTLQCWTSLSRLFMVATGSSKSSYPAIITFFSFCTLVWLCLPMTDTCLPLVFIFLGQYFAVVYLLFLSFVSCIEYVGRNGLFLLKESGRHFCISFGAAPVLVPRTSSSFRQTWAVLSHRVSSGGGREAKWRTSQRSQLDFALLHPY